MWKALTPSMPSRASAAVAAQSAGSPCGTSGVKPRVPAAPCADPGTSTGAGGMRPGRGTRKKMTATTARMTSRVRIMSPAVPRTPRRADGSGGDGCSSVVPVGVLTRPWCRVGRVRAEPAACRGATPSMMWATDRRGGMDDVLVVGEALVDIVRRVGALDPPSAEGEEHPGGSPANVALGLGRLGRRVALLPRLGDDPRGRRVRPHLAASAVELVPGTVVAGPTSTATATLDGRGVASYQFVLDWRLPEQVELPPARALHTGSIAAFLAPGGDAVLELVRRSAGTMTVSYDPNARPVLMGAAELARRRVEAFVAASDVVKVSDEDLTWLAPGADVLDVARAWLALGPALVVVTRGGEGAVAVCRDGDVSVPAPAVDVVDTVGAGDAFTAGLLDALAAADLLGADRRGALHAIDRARLAAAARH